MKLTPKNIRLASVVALIPISLLSIATLNSPQMRTSLAHGPIQTGHSALACHDCHVKPDASWRQQIQANVMFSIGKRETPVDFGFHKVDSKACLSCHERPNERHPIYRFREPRFQLSVDQVEATSCLGCHTEHTGARVSTDLEFCSACHGSLELKSDPIDVSHKTLTERKNWASCLGCHDFHGNHVFKTPLTLDKAFRTDDLVNYLNDGPSPYGTNKQFEAKQP